MIFCPKLAAGSERTVEGSVHLLLQGTAPGSALSYLALSPLIKAEKGKISGMTPQEARWKRMMFKGNKVYASVDEGGALLVQDGRVEIKYQLNQEATYRALASSVKEIDEAVLQEMKKARKESKQASKTPTQPSTPIISNTDAIDVFTDGACGGNPGPAGIGIVLEYGHHKKTISRFIGDATNNIAELMAIKTALEEIQDPHLPVNVYTDSAYCQQTLTGSWKAKKNRELIEEIRKEMTRFPSLKLIKVEGHKGVEGNEEADQLAQQAVRKRITDKKKREEPSPSL